LYSGYEVWRLRLFSFCGYGLALVLFGAYDSYPVSLGLYSGYELWRLQLVSFCGYGLALAALALVLFGAYDSYPETCTEKSVLVKLTIN